MQPHVGDAVVFIDENRVARDALITAVHDDTCVNLVLVNRNRDQQDTYGRQIERETSCQHRSLLGRPVGKFWRFRDEDPSVDLGPPQET